ncbi:hypothetical protein AgCh_039634 [Apium graveolens]
MTESRHNKYYKLRYFLNLFGLRGLFSLIVGEENAIDDTQCMIQMSGFGFDPSKVEREVERDNEVARGRGTMIVSMPVLVVEDLIVISDRAYNRIEVLEMDGISVFNFVARAKSCSRNHNPDHRLFASINNHRRQLATSLETVKWQLEVFYNKINPLRSVKNLLSSYGTRGYRSFTKKWEDAEE